MESIALNKMVEALDLPDTAYEAAKSRYEDLGTWLERPESDSSAHDPHIFAQGSFRLGTAIRPLDSSESYDLDLACKLREGITKTTHTQKSLKALIGKDLESYRQARNIKSPLEPKHRCWRLEYQDGYNFHMDIVPCIPAGSDRQFMIKEAMIRSGEEAHASQRDAELAVTITDDRRVGYDQICDDWLVSNPEGYAKWFESRMRLCGSYLTERARMVKAAQIDDLQYYQWKTPLQRCIQLLKRHRDTMFQNNADSKPISAIITTIAARAYQGELDIGTAMTTILANMERFVRSTNPRVPNPVNPSEDFADRWSMQKYTRLQLEGNFRRWIVAAKADFATISESRDASFVVKQASSKFALSLNESTLRAAIGASTTPLLYTPKTHSITDSSKPWGN
jgi:hypothetical protein